MSSENTPELGITEEDRKRMGEIARKRFGQGSVSRVGNHGLDGNAVETALDVCPEGSTPAKLLVAAYLFESGSRTAQEVVDATGVSFATAKGALDSLVDHRLAHTNSERKFGGRGRKPTVYVPCPDGLPQSYR